MNIFSAYIEKPNNIRFATQEPGEKIIFALRKAFITNFPWIFLSILALLAPSFYMNYVIKNGTIFEFALGSELENIFIALWYLITIIYSIERFINWYFNVYIVTDRRIIDIDFRPLFYKNISEATYDNVEDTSFSMNNIFQTIFNYGNVFIQTAAEKTQFEFIDVPNPAIVQDKVSDLAAKASNNN